MSITTNAGTCPSASRSSFVVGRVAIANRFWELSCAKFFSALPLSITPSEGYVISPFLVASSQTYRFMLKAVVCTSLNCSRWSFIRITVEIGGIDDRPPNGTEPKWETCATLAWVRGTAEAERTNRRVEEGSDKCEPSSGSSKSVDPKVGAPRSLGGKDQGTWSTSMSKCVSPPWSDLQFLFFVFRNGCWVVSTNEVRYTGGPTTGCLYALLVSVLPRPCPLLFFIDLYLGVGSQIAPLATHGPILVTPGCSWKCILFSPTCACTRAAILGSWGEKAGKKIEHVGGGDDGPQMTGE